MKRLIGLCAWLACLPAFGADAVSELQLRRAGNESGVLRAVIPEGTVGFCRDQPSVAKAVEAHVHGSRELRLLECFVQPAARVALQPVYTVSVHPATLDWAMPEKEFESLVGPPISSPPLEQEVPPGGALKKTIMQWVLPAGGRRFMDCRRLTKVYERDGKQVEEKAFTCSRYLYIEGWAIVLGLLDGQAEDTETRVPADLEAWATRFAAANARKN